MFATHPPAHHAFPELGTEEEPKLFSFPGEIGLKSELVPIAKSS